jgi:D-alanine-D-alanine ligase
MKIAVFMGGSSEERDVSLSSGGAVAAALRGKSHTVSAYDVEWYGKYTFFSAVDKIRANGIDAVYLALHGGLGENGGVQGILEAAGLPYTGSGIAGSAVAMDKHISKTLFRHHGIRTAPWITGTPEELDASRVEREVGWPCVVKPVDQGSTIGLTVVKKPERLKEAIDSAARVGTRIVAESFIPGKELSVPVLGDQALPIIEICPSHETYDYECKYTSGMTRYYVPAPIPEEVAAETRELALRVFRLLGLRDIARIDFRLDAEGRPVCLEANTLPGMTATSLVPKSAAAAGIDFPELVDRIAGMAYRRKGNR